MNLFVKKLKKFIKYSLLSVTLKFIHKDEIIERVFSLHEKTSLNHIKSGYLHDIGWWKSRKKNEPINLNNEPLPWTTYGFIDFISERLSKDMEVFEFGSGNSTFYYSSKVKEVYTVEHDLDWYNKVSINLPENVSLNHVELVYNENYCRTAINSNRQYDIIIVDGRDRVNCMLNAISCLKKKGVLVLDDSERESYKLGIEAIKSKGFKHLDFWGISPGFMAYKKCTSIYYKSDNILNI